MTIIKKYNLDKDEAKRDLIEYFQSLDRYKDWDFDAEGSALNLLMEILSYNTGQNGFIANRLSSELKLETAQKRSTVVSGANTLGGYLPKSARCSRGKIKIKINSFGNKAIPEFILVPKGQKFISTNGFEFFTIENYVIYPDTNGFASIDDVEIYEGRRISYEANGANNGFVISNENFDFNTLNISIDDSNAKQVGYEIDISQVEPESNVYFIKENFEGRYEISFGDGFYGKQTTASNKINVDYIVSLNLDEANGLSEFTTDPIDGFGDITIITETKTNSGSTRETIDSIKNNAPRFFSAANRAVNKNDFSYLIERNFDFVKSASVFGGEESRNFGNVFCVALNQNNEDITFSQKETIKEFLIDYTVASITTQFIEPEILEIFPLIEIILDPKDINFSVNNSRVIVQNSITNYGESISGFKSSYSSTDLSNFIETDLPGIRFIDVQTKINKFVPLKTNGSIETEIDFKVSLFHPFDGYGKEADGVIISTEIKDERTGIVYFINDDGFGNLRLYFNNENGQKTYVSEKQGKINYNTGKAELNPFPALALNEYTLRAIPAKNILEVKENSVIRLSGKNATVVIKTNV